MRSPTIAAFATLFVAVLPLTIHPAPARAQSPPDDGEIRIARLVHQLGSESYRDRFEAGDKLAKLGPQCRGALEAAAISDDAEVRLRAGELLRQLRADDLWLPAAVSCRCQGQPASQALATIAEQSGNHLSLGQPFGTFRDATLETDYPSGQFWPVVDDICRKTGNQVRSDFQLDHRGSVIIAGPPGENPTAYAGPFRAQITEATRSFAEKMRFSGARPEQTNSFELELNLRWEDRFHPVASRAVPEFVEGITDTGVRLAELNAGHNPWSVVENSERQLTARIKLDPPPILARQFARLVLRWGIIAVGDPTALVIDDLAVGKAIRQDDVDASIEQLNRPEPNRIDITLLVSRDGPMPEPQEVLFEEYAVELLDAAGQPFHLQNQANQLTERGTQLRLTFGGDFAQNPAKRLRLAYPRVRDSREMTFEFHNVPLPTGAPK